MAFYHGDSSLEILSEQAVNEPFEECFALSVDLPLNYQVSATKLTQRDLDSINILNNTLLDIVLSKSDMTIDTTDADEVLVKQLRLTEAKVDLALVWLSRLIFPVSEIPRSQKFELNSYGIRFYDNQPITKGRYLQIQIYVDGEIAEPVRFAAEVENSDGNKTTARFIDMESRVSEKLEKYIFRTHRRVIARKQHN